MGEQSGTEDSFKLKIRDILSQPTRWIASSGEFLDLDSLCTD